MREVVCSHQPNHPRYQETRIHQSIIDKENNRAAFVLFEQIDTSGELENQYRYSLWFVRDREEPRQIYENHEYMKNPVYYKGSLGRDPTIGLEEILADGVVATLTPEEGGIACTLSQIKVKIGLDGKINEPEDFIEQARNLVKMIGPKLGYDFVSDMSVSGTERLKGENVTVLLWRAEDGSTYNYDTVYLVWKDKSGQLRNRTLTDSRSSQDYLSADIKTEGKEIEVDVKGRKFRVSREKLNL